MTRAGRDPRAACVVLAVAAAAAVTLPVSLGLMPTRAIATGLVADASIAVLLAAALVTFQRPSRRAALVCAALAAAPLAASSAKLAALGDTAELGDLLLAADAARTLPPWLVAAGVAALLVLLVSYAANVRLPTLREGVIALAGPCLALFGFWSAIASPIAAEAVARLLPMPEFRLPAYGHWVQATTRFVDEAQRAHVLAAAADVDPADLPLAIGAAALPPLAARNVHIVVAESLVDPAWLSAYDLAPDPATPFLRAWRGRGGGDRALVPVFGNRSSNTEFEVLCGVPALTQGSGLVFNAVTRPLDCLPRLLGARGFDTVGRVPSHPSFFSAETAYRHAGFARTEFDRDFEPGDVDGRWLSAAATLAHARRRIAEGLAEGLADGRPFLDYTFVNAAHFPFERDRARRPDVAAVSPHDGTVHDYVNAVHYSFVAIEEHLAWLATHDPEAIVVVLGDHAPPLGADHAPYRASGRAENGLVAGPTGEPGMMQTPLVVLDAGVPVATGVLPAYAIPELVLDRLSGGRLCAARACLHRAEARLRPHRVTPMIASERGETVRACHEQDADAACVAARRETLLWDVVLARLLAGAPVPAGDTRENDGGARAQHVSSAK
ncbi:sulfatase-like hydrolase/transferase [Salinarimonas rosea]|uniref:sulfatase-like hydrolase/transferase n=1 Tax=Salinarimonas rosea TaxID=552063 RepID=UPI0012EC0105|nr:sulfatase-like hydrolase/transferase [Salinarimonas rosea]